jgi:hypothetical protein
MNNDVKYIGVTGLARTGKNLFCDIAVKQLREKHNLRAKTYAIAYDLKKDCAAFVKEKLGLDVFTENTAEKAMFRDLLVWYGATKRKQTQGTYWTTLLEQRIKNELEVENSLLNEPVDVVFVSDIRFAEYEKDEVFWIKEHLGGKLVHISKYDYSPLDKTRRVYVEPPNASEAANDPKVKMYANCFVDWRAIDTKDLIDNDYLNSQVEKALQAIL